MGQLKNANGSHRRTVLHECQSAFPGWGLVFVHKSESMPKFMQDYALLNIAQDIVVPDPAEIHGRRTTCSIPYKLSK
jgi:hypothetical protein